jgi:hypothetical protein
MNRGQYDGSLGDFGQLRKSTPNINQVAVTFLLGQWTFGHFTRKYGE